MLGSVLLKESIFGIPCGIRSKQMQQGIRIVLRQVRERSPEDFKRLRQRILRLAPLAKDYEDNAAGKWTPPRKMTAKWEYPGAWSQGVVRLQEASPHKIALVAHELGHACTTELDYERLGGGFDVEWETELLADKYGYKWGFGRQISQDRKLNRSLLHHGPAPGTVFTVENGQSISRYRVTRSFRIRFIGRRRTTAKRAATKR